MRRFITHIAVNPPGEVSRTVCDAPWMSPCSDAGMTFAQLTPEVLT